jgi:riboflavin synthase
MLRHGAAGGVELIRLRPMFTGIIQGVAHVQAVQERPGLRSFRLGFPPGFAEGLAVGASVACDGVCLTVTALHGPDAADFDMMQQSLALTTLAGLGVGERINVERAARDGAEIGGHPLSGHVDFQATVAQIRTPENNRVLRIAVPPRFVRYVFAKGYIALNGASLTVAEADRREAWFEVWLIPETLRMTTFGDKRVGDTLNVEIERATQVLVDTMRDALEERLGPLLPALEALLQQRRMAIDDLGAPLPLPR